MRPEYTGEPPVIASKEEEEPAEAEEGVKVEEVEEPTEPKKKDDEKPADEKVETKDDDDRDLDVAGYDE